MLVPARDIAFFNASVNILQLNKCHRDAVIK